MSTYEAFEPGGIANLVSNIESYVGEFCPFPVGAVLQMTNGNDPNTFYPGTTWQQISGVFLMASSSSHALGTTGGSETVTLTVDNLPSHTHTIGAHKHTVPEHGHTYTRPTVSSSGYVANGVPSNGAHEHDLVKKDSTSSTFYVSGKEANGYALVNVNAASCGFQNRALVDTSATTNGSRFIAKSNGAHTHNLPNHTHTLTGGSVANKAAFDTDNSAAFNSGSSGGGAAVSKMPPYKVVNVWERTA